MKNQKIPIKILACISMLSGSIWLGAYLLRMMMSYQLFDIDLNLLPEFNEINLKGILKILTPAINTTFVMYIVFVLSFSLLFFTSRIKLKEDGWFFIIIVIVYVTLPFEAYLMFIDFKLITLLNFGEIINTNYAVGLIRERFSVLNGFPIIIILSYCSIIYFLVFKPFVKPVN